jgi:hypothetical protein
MKLRFNLTDEKTVTNSTVKITTAIRGTINGECREKIEARCLALVKSLFPDNKWAFSNFSYNGDGLTFSVAASTRIEAALNEQLEEKAKNASTADTKLSVTHIDPSIPSHDMRRAESELRVRLVGLANAEAKTLGGNVTRVEFEPSYSAGLSNSKSMSAMATYASAAPAGGGAPQLGHSEKIMLTAMVTISSDGLPEDEAVAAAG